MSHVESALAAFHDAQADGSAVDWQALAAALAAAIPAPKRRKASGDAAPDYWTAYALPKAQAFISEPCFVTFADGVTVRSNVHRVHGKPWRIEAAMRYAVALWRRRTGSDGIAPEIDAIALADASEAWDGATVTRLSVAIRAALPPVRPALRTPTMATLAFLEAERARREAGMMRARAIEAGPRAARPKDHVSSAAWGAALHGIRQEILDTRRALGLSDAMPQDPDAIAAALADAYAQPTEWEIAGTIDAPDPARGCAPHSATGSDCGPVLSTATPAEVMPETSDGPRSGFASPAATATGPAFVSSDLDHDPVSLAAAPSPADAMALCPSVGQPCRTGCSHRSGCGAPAYHTHVPAETLGDDWVPTDASHPVVAVCLSLDAMRALHGAIMDGTAPARGRTAKGGAWRISLADALALQGIASIRWVGMPRKAYTRRPAAPPVNAMVPPVNAFAPIPHHAFTPGAGRIPSTVTFHAAP